MARVTVRLHGILKTDLEEMNFEVSSVKEVVTAVMSYLNRVKPELVASENKLKLQVSGYDTDEDMKIAPEEGAILNVMPAVSVGKKAGFFQVLLGAALIAAAFIPGLQGVALAGTKLSTMLLTMGAGMAIGGLIQMIAPTPTIDTVPQSTNPEASKYISGTSNTVRHGTRIALGGGTVIWYGHMLSVNVQSRDVATGGSNTYANPDFGGGFSGSVLNYAYRNQN